MGWTSCHVGTKYDSKNKCEYVDRKEECDKLFNTTMVNDNGDTIGKYEVLHSTMRSSTYYAAVKQTNFATNESSVFGVVCLTHTEILKYHNFSYKDMCETMGPCRYDCPKKIIDLLDETNNEYALNWRAKCLVKNKEKYMPNTLGKLPIGSKIRFKAPCDLKLYKKGEYITVCKQRRPNGGKSYWIDGYYYYSTKLIGKEYEVIEKGN